MNAGAIQAGTCNGRDGSEATVKKGSRCVAVFARAQRGKVGKNERVDNLHGSVGCACSGLGRKLRRECHMNIPGVTE